MRLLDFLVADDIRRELGNKISVMGVFNDTINLNLPANAAGPILFRLGLFVRVLIDETDEIPDRFRLIILHNDANIAEFGGTISSKERAKLITLPFVANPLPLPGLGVLNFQLELFKGDVNLFLTTSPFPIEVT